MVKEIGSEFWEVPTIDANNPFFSNTEWFLSGRSALQAIIKDMSIKSVSLPDWCCDSIIIPFTKSDIRTEFYSALQPIRSIKTDAILIMDYFGYTGYSNIENYQGVVIRDLTHSIFSKKYEDADYYFGSLRKWAGFWTGGYAWGFRHSIDFQLDDYGYTILRKKAMLSKSQYINSRSDGIPYVAKYKAYLNIFENAEDILEDVGIVPAASRDIDFANKLDINLIMKKRRDNSNVLLKAFTDIAIFPEVNDKDCPMFVPVRVRNRDALRKYLINHEIYCPVHWPLSTYHHIDESAKSLYAEELSLVCDQRYDEEDMLRIIDTIKSFERGEI